MIPSALKPTSAPNSRSADPSKNKLSPLLWGVCTILAASSIYLLFKEAFIARWSTLFDPFTFSGDALQHIAPLWFVRDPAQASHDYIATYYLVAIAPPLFKGLYAFLTLFASPLAVSKTITVVLSALFIITVTMTSRYLAGGVAAYLAALFASGAVLKNMYFMGGIQRGFGIWLSSLALYCACSGRFVPLGGLAIAASLLYPAAAVFILTALTLLLFLPPHARGSTASWPLKKRCGFLMLCVVSCALAVAPQLLGGSQYGLRLSRSYEALYPEWGTGGRYTEGDRGVPAGFIKTLSSGVVSSLAATRVKAPKLEQLRSDDESDDSSTTLTPAYRVGVVITLSVVSLAWILYRKRLRVSPATIRAMTFCAAMIVSFVAASVLFPLLYIPSRYVTLGSIPLVPVTFSCLWTAAAATLLEARSRLVSSALAVSLGAVAFVWLGWLQPAIRSLPSASGHLPLFRFVRTLPSDAVIAGWPRGVMNQLPLFTAHAVLLFEEGHQIFHKDCTDELRNRMRAIIALYSATNTKALTELQQRYKVTHILLDTRHLEKAPRYFAPFDHEMQTARATAAGKSLLLADLARTNAVFQQGNFVLIDLDPKK